MSYRIAVVAGRLPRESSSRQLAATRARPTPGFGPLPGRIDEWRLLPHKQNLDARRPGLAPVGTALHCIRCVTPHGHAQLSPRAVARPSPWPRASDRNHDRGAR